MPKGVLIPFDGYRSIEDYVRTELYGGVPRDVLVDRLSEGLGISKSKARYYVRKYLHEYEKWKARVPQ